MDLCVKKLFLCLHFDYEAVHSVLSSFINKHVL